MAAGDITALPDGFVVLGIEAKCSVGFELKINSPRLDYSGRRGIGVHRIGKRFRVVARNENAVEKDFSALLIEANYRHLTSILRCRRQPDFPLGNNRGRPSESVNVDFPRDILFLGPFG